jgi:hypothetical protein
MVGNVPTFQLLRKMPIIQSTTDAADGVEILVPETGVLALALAAANRSPSHQGVGTQPNESRVDPALRCLQKF